MVIKTIGASAELRGTLVQVIQHQKYEDRTFDVIYTAGKIRKEMSKKFQVLNITESSEFFSRVIVIGPAQLADAGKYAFTDKCNETDRTFKFELIILSKFNPLCRSSINFFLLISHNTSYLTTHHC